MRTFEQLETLFGECPAAPRDRGQVQLIVVRPDPGERKLVERAQLSPETGLHGDRWAASSPPKLEAQLSLMSARVAELVADDQDVSLIGDNLLVDLDLSMQSLPTGTRLRLGTALVQVTAKLHTGCKKFRERFGLDALRWVNYEQNRAARLRGMFCRVIEAGEVACGDAIVVVSRPPDSGQKST